MRPPGTRTYCLNSAASGAAGASTGAAFAAAPTNKQAAKSRCFIVGAPCNTALARTAECRKLARLEAKSIISPDYRPKRWFRWRSSESETYQAPRCEGGERTAYGRIQCVGGGFGCARD